MVMQMLLLWWLWPADGETLVENGIGGWLQLTIKAVSLVGVGLSMQFLREPAFRLVSACVCWLNGGV